METTATEYPTNPKFYALRVNGKANIRKVAKSLLDAQIYFQVNPVSDVAVIFAVLDWTNGNGINCPEVLRQALHKAVGE